MFFTVIYTPNSIDQRSYSKKDAWSDTLEVSYGMHSRRKWKNAGPYSGTYPASWCNIKSGMRHSNTDAGILTIVSYEINKRVRWKGKNIKTFTWCNTFMSTHLMEKQILRSFVAVDLYRYVYGFKSCGSPLARFLYIRISAASCENLLTIFCSQVECTTWLLLNGRWTGRNYIRCYYLFMTGSGDRNGTKWWVLWENCLKTKIWSLF